MKPEHSSILLKTVELWFDGRWDASSLPRYDESHLMLLRCFPGKGLGLGDWRTSKLTKKKITWLKSAPPLTRLQMIAINEIVTNIRTIIKQKEGSV